MGQVLLQASHNYRENNMDTYLLTAQIDTREGKGRIASRIGISEAAETFAPGSPEFVALELSVGSRGNGLSVEGPSVRN